MNKEKLLAKGIEIPKGFSAGFSRAVVNPLPGTGLSGWGNPKVRLSGEVLDDLMHTCTALCDGENIFLLLSHDVLSVRDVMLDHLAERVAEEYGIPAENIIMNATHTHCAPLMGWRGFPGTDDYMNRFWEAVYRITDEAIRDLAPATLRVGQTHTNQLNHVRRYISKKDGSFIGNWPKWQYPEDARHETMPDTLLQVMHLVREEKKDIILCNWQCHPCSDVAGERKTEVSADWIGTMRTEVEERFDAHFSYHQGACGNLVTSSRIVGEMSLSASYKVKGKFLCQAVKEAMDAAFPMETGPFKAKRVNFVATYTSEAKAREKEGDTTRLYLNALSIGPVAFASVPCEYHDTCGKAIRDGAPFKATFLCGYSNGYFSYIPANFCWENGGYEVKKCLFVRGTGEKMVTALTEALTEIR
jgi:hypothetical protein